MSASCLGETPAGVRGAAEQKATLAERRQQFRQRGPGGPPPEESPNGNQPAAGRPSRGTSHRGGVS